MAMAKYDPITIIGFTTSILAIISCVFTLVTLSREWRRRAAFARDVINIHRREIDVLGSVLDECRGMIASTANPPKPIVEALGMCEQRRADLEKVMAVAVPAMRRAKTWRTSWLAVNLKLPLLEKDLKRKYEMYKEDVVLLRALCAEYGLLRNLGVGILTVETQVEIATTACGGDVSKQPLCSLTNLTRHSASLARLISGYAINMDSVELDGDDCRTLAPETISIDAETTSIHVPLP